MCGQDTFSKSKSGGRSQKSCGVSTCRRRSNQPETISYTQSNMSTTESTPREKKVTLAIDFDKRKCHCNWSDCEILHKSLVASRQLKDHPWAQNFYHFGCPDGAGIKLRALRYNLAHHFKFTKELDDTKEVKIAPHHFPLSLLEGKPGNRTNFLAKDEAK